jgi:peptide/nickel transport system substrate-binding protein
MDEQGIRELVREVRRGRMSRRGFLSVMASFGIPAPMAAAILSHAGIAYSAALPAYKPTKRGGGGTLRLLWWQGPTLLNPHFATGTKDADGSRLFYEPLAGWHPDGVLIPILAAEVPSLENGGVSADGRRVTWKLKRNVQWHDGKPFTADDVVFTWQYVTDPATAAVTSGSYREMTVDKMDSHTVRITFNKPSPFWAEPFVGGSGGIIPKHLFADFKGSRSREAPANLKPVGTGPYVFVDFKPADMLRGRMNPNYHEPNRPFFDAVEMKGGGDAVSAARASCRPASSTCLERARGGRDPHAAREGRKRPRRDRAERRDRAHPGEPGGSLDGGGRRAANAKTRHPTLSRPGGARGARPPRRPQEHPAAHLRPPRDRHAELAQPPRALPLAQQRDGLQPAEGEPRPRRGRLERGPDGVRAKDGKKLKYVYQTSTNAPRQKIQQIVKQACQKAGIELELKSVAPAVFFSSDEGNPDTDGKFYATCRCTTSARDAGSALHHELLLFLGDHGQRPTSGRDATARAGAATSTTASTATPKSSSTREARRTLHPHERPRGAGARRHSGREPQRCVRRSIAAQHHQRLGQHRWLLKDWYRES